MESPGLEPTGQVSYHRLGGRDVDDPLSNVVVTNSDRGWHCPDCIHIATTKGNLKSHILSGRHKVAEKNFKCRFCDRSYSTRQSLQVHISTNHRRENCNLVKMKGILYSLPFRKKSCHGISHFFPADFFAIFLFSKC